MNGVGPNRVENEWNNAHFLWPQSAFFEFDFFASFFFFFFFEKCITPYISITARWISKFSSHTPPHFSRGIAWYHSHPHSTISWIWRSKCTKIRILSELYLEIFRMKSVLDSGHFVGLGLMNMHIYFTSIAFAYYEHTRCRLPLHPHFHFFPTPSVTRKQGYEPIYPGIYPPLFFEGYRVVYLDSR